MYFLWVDITKIVFETWQNIYDYWTKIFMLFFKFWNTYVKAEMLVLKGLDNQMYL